VDSLLLRNGLVIDTEPAPVAHHNHDVLIQDGRIAAVGANLPVPAGTTVLDATNRIVLPGLVDTHRHVWQAVLRSIAVDVDLPVYFKMVRQQIGPRFRPEDVRAANLLGALECLDGGVTTVQDFAYARADRITPDGYVAGESDFDYAEAALDGLRAVGIRAVFGYLLTPEDTAAVRRTQALFGAANPQLTMAAASLGPSNQRPDAIRADWRLAEELGLPIVTHVASGPVNERPIEVLRDNGLLHSNILYVHGNSLADDELAMIADSGGAVSITPAVEARLGHGGPLIGRLASAGVTTGLGVDVVTTVSGDMFSVLRAGLLTSYLAFGPHLTPADLLRMATLDGAVALGLGDQVGSLKVGKQADVVLLRADDLNLACAHDPIGAVVSSAHAGNVDTVLVAGKVVKQNGRLLGHDLSEVRARAREAAEYVTHDTAAAAG
jgi:cytosine/adenosine deaminase-related metal-dependent hydrolase